MELWLVRHGESTWNQARRFQGARDAALSPRGWAQARALAGALDGEAFDAFYTSPLRRARDTAAACAGGVGPPPAPMDDLRELSLGDWEGLSVETVVQRYGEHYWRWLTKPGDYPPPGGEPMAAVRSRVVGAIERIRLAQPKGRVLVVSHGGVIATFLCAHLGLGLNAVWRLRIDNAAITRIALPGGRLLALNDLRHLTPAPVSEAAP